MGFMASWTGGNVNRKGWKGLFEGGICNLTSPVYVHGARFFWPCKRINNLAAELVQCEIDIYEDVVQHQLKGKVVPIPEMGADLIWYNQIDLPWDWMLTHQKDLDTNLPLIHATTKDLNKAMGVKTPWTLDVLYKTAKNGVRYPGYSVLQDGLHPSSLRPQRSVSPVKYLKTWMNFLRNPYRLYFYICILSNGCAL